MKYKCFAILFTCLLATILHSKETEKRIYVSPHQIEIKEHGFIAHLNTPNKTVAGKTMSVDQHGLYIKEWKGPCWIHDLWCPRCGGCGVLFCPMNCSCFD